MKLNSEQRIQITKHFMNVQKRCEGRDKSLKEFLCSIAPNTRNFTIYENDELSGALEMLKLIDDESHTIIHSFFYDGWVDEEKQRFLQTGE